MARHWPLRHAVLRVAGTGCLAAGALAIAICASSVRAQQTEPTEPLMSGAAQSALPAGELMPSAAQRPTPAPPETRPPEDFSDPVPGALGVVGPAIDASSDSSLAPDQPSETPPSAESAESEKTSTGGDGLPADGQQTIGQRAVDASADSPAAESQGSEPTQTAPGDQPAAQESLEPIPDPENAPPVAVEPASFKGVTPGQSTLAEVDQAWGAPKEVRKQGELLVQLYSVEPFDRVEASFYQGKVVSIVIRLQQSFPAKVVAEQLELATIRPVLVSNELGEILGQAYPERGVLFAFEPATQPGKPSMNVAQIVLEPITPEPFVLRAETYLESRPEVSLQDLDQALKLQADNARAHWLRARALGLLGRLDEAVKAMAEATRLEPDNAHYRVTQAQLLGQLGHFEEAVKQARQAVELSQHKPHVRARALCLLGDLLASGAKPDYKQAIEYHIQAVRAADPLTADPHPAVRLPAKEVMVDAHLGAGHDIAWGQWKDKEAAVTRWLERAEAFAEELIENEGGSEELRFRVASRALAICVGMQGVLDPEPWAQKALETGKQLIDACSEPGLKVRYQADLGMAMYDALQVCQMRDEQQEALRYGEQAAEYLEAAQAQQALPNGAYLLGRLYFRLGAIHAIGDQNHRAAITWFDKAVPLLSQPLPKEAAADLGRHGETFVSMGVSYWETGQREKAVELTQKGVALMEHAVAQGTLDEQALAIPYGNLAAMHRELGQPEAARRYQEMAAKVRKSATR